MSASPASVCPKCEPLVASALAAELAREGAAARVELEKQRERVAELEAELRSLRLELAVRSSSGPPTLLSVPSASGSDISAPYSYTRSPAATVLQAHLRGWRQRSRYAAARQVFAVVTGTSSLGAAGAWRDVPTYTITVIRAGCCWQRAAPAFAEAAAVYDRSTGTTAQSHTQGVVTPSPVSSPVTVSSTTTSLGTGRASGLPWQRQPGRTESESSRAGV
ncbi:hypothetical protein EMIHUDRAFT_222380 [Emiliania huxleyi CCMP1516]|uniref:Uncharacterized protein n=2 Tax=Emiliania huxleyi TaxID=2903 RepID=A0A0D3KY29_EMIH1|nr:hypothetical protein EMIHUDRAFT_222380 [Emiliania huxleyi CCMP1516]EOD40664.1 hypothetical protein EMIHUDRAFT_222380 [Emiliania huxleyi CCMP1516]|eukprot:XP_005793093.1 hypothetical protein EMIHUDRAFT_222380 [Emiliania huxleyi CCMP1516]